MDGILLLATVTCRGFNMNQNRNSDTEVATDRAEVHELTADEVELVSGAQRPWGTSFIYCPAGDGGSKFDRYD